MKPRRIGPAARPAAIDDTLTRCFGGTDRLNVQAASRFLAKANFADKRIGWAAAFARPPSSALAVAPFGAVGQARHKQIPYVDKVSGGSYLSRGNAASVSSPPANGAMSQADVIHALCDAPPAAVPRRAEKAADAAREKGSQE